MPRAYATLQSFLRRLVGVFFREVQVTGQDHVPDDRGGVVVSWHPNGLIDPGLILTQFPRQVVFGARHGLFKWPLLGTLLRSLGTVPIFRASDDRSGDPDSEVARPDFGTTLSTVKPLVWDHPRTGRELLWLCEQMTSEVVELDAEESEALLRELFAHLYSPENRWQHEWREGDLLLWDNVAVQHSRPDVIEDGPVRTLRKFGTPHPDMGSAHVPTYERAAT